MKSIKLTRYFLKYKHQTLNKIQTILNQTKQSKFNKTNSKQKVQERKKRLLFKIIRTSMSDPEPDKSSPDPQH